MTAYPVSANGGRGHCRRSSGGRAPGKVFGFKAGSFTGGEDLTVVDLWWVSCAATVRQDKIAA